MHRIATAFHVVQRNGGQWAVHPGDKLKYSIPFDSCNRSESIPKLKTDVEEGVRLSSR